MYIYYHIYIDTIYNIIYIYIHIYIIYIYIYIHTYSGYVGVDTKGMAWSPDFTRRVFFEPVLVCGLWFTRVPAYFGQLPFARGFQSWIQGAHRIV